MCHVTAGASEPPDVGSTRTTRRKTGRASTSPEAALIAHTTVWRALQLLSPRRRAAIVLHELDGVSTAQIARLLGVSLVTVRWHLSRGRRELARAIVQDEVGNP